MNIEKHIQYWVAGSKDECSVAQSLFERGHFRQALFFGHLAVEKMLKAHVTRATQSVPPYTHDLLRLAELANLNLKDEEKFFFRRLQEYCLEGRYPKSSSSTTSKDETLAVLRKTEEILQWLNSLS